MEVRRISPTYLRLFGFAIIVMVAFFVRVGVDAPIVSPDGKQYLRIAENVLNNGCYSSSPPAASICKPTWGYQPPGYPTFIVLVKVFFGDSLEVIIIIQSLLYSLALSYALFSAAPLFRSYVALLVTGIVLAISPFTTPWSYWVLTETLASAASLWVGAECLRSLSNRRFRTVPLALALTTAALLRWDLFWLLVPVIVVGVYLLDFREMAFKLAVLGLTVSIPFFLLMVRAVVVGLPAIPINIDASEAGLPPGIPSFLESCVSATNCNHRIDVESLE